MILIKVVEHNIKIIHKFSKEVTTRLEKYYTVTLAQGQGSKYITLIEHTSII